MGEDPFQMDEGQPPDLLYYREDLFSGKAEAPQLGIDFHRYRHNDIFFRPYFI